MGIPKPTAGRTTPMIVGGIVLAFIALLLFTHFQKPAPIAAFKATDPALLSFSIARPDEASVTILDSFGEKTEFPISKQTSTRKLDLKIEPKRSFQPGKYTAQVTNKDGTKITQDFMWGVLAVNPDKSIYTPNQKAYIAYAVLDETGNMVCDARVTVTIKNPKHRISDTLSTENGSIKVNPECEQKAKVDRDDFESTYQVSGIGEYELRVVAETENGTYEIADSIEVRNSVPFDVRRESRTRIFPIHDYDMNLTITAHQDFSGYVTETVPEEFVIKQLSDAATPFEEYSSNESGTRLLAWDVTIKRGETITLGYIYDSPDRSPWFFTTGPLEFKSHATTQTVFAESRQWQIAVDAVSGQTQFFLQRESADVNTTYNAMTVSRPWDNSAFPNGSDTQVDFSSAPCEGTDADEDGRINVDMDDTTGTTGEKCVATFFSPPVGQHISMSTSDSDSLSVTIDTQKVGSGNDGIIYPKARFYKYDGSTYTLITTLTGTVMPTSQTEQTITGTPTSNVNFLPNDRLVLLLTGDITQLDTTGGTDRFSIYFAERSDAPSNVVMKYSITTPYKPELSGPKDDDFTVVQAETECNTGITYNTKWTCVEGADDGSLQVDVTSGSGTSGWLILEDKENSSLDTNFGTTPGNTYIYQTVNTNTDGDGFITTVMNSGTRAGAGTSPYSHGGLLLWTSNTDYLILQVMYDGTTRGIAINDDGTLLSTTEVPLYNRVWLRWSKSGNDYQAYYSTDGIVFTKLGSAITHATAFTRVGMTSYVGTASEEYSPAFDWFDYALGGDLFQDYLVGHWKFDEGYGTTANNSGSAIHTINGSISGATWSNNGKVKKALDFDNSNDSVSMGVNSIFEFGSDESFSISAWVKSDTNDGFIFFYGDTDDQWYALQHNDSGYFSFDIDDDVTKSSATTTTTYGTDTWYHVTGVRDRANDEIRIYVNGLLADTTTDDTGSINNSTQRTTYIGRKTTTGAGGQYYDGLIDEVKVYQTALSDDEVKVDYNAGNVRKLGVLGTDASGNPSDAIDRSYCPPGDTTSSCGPSAHWPFKKGIDTTAQDVTGNGHTATLSNGPTWSNGKVGKSVTLDGSDDFVDSTAPDITNGSISVWVRPTSLPSSTERDIILTYYTTGTSEQFSAHDKTFFINSSGIVKFRIYDGASKLVSSTSSLSVNQWYHLTATIDGTNLRLYVNGRLEGTTSAGSSYDFTSASVRLAGLVDTVGDGESTRARFNGSIDEVKIYNYARSASQVAWEYNNGGPILHYKFDECTGTTAYDSSGNGKNGTIVPGASGTNTSASSCSSVSASDMRYNGRNGKRNYGLNFDTTNDYITVSSPNLPTGDFSYAFWVNVDNFSADDHIIYASDGSGGNEFKVKSENSSGAIDVQVNDSVVINSTTNTLTAGQWHHVVVTRSGATITVYIDGIADPTTGSNSTTLDFSTCPLIIGADNDSLCDSDLNEFLGGYLDDVRVYNFALTSNQVRTVMNDGAVRWGPNTGAP